MGVIPQTDKRNILLNYSAMEALFARKNES